jgi:pyridoxamine 5'-phosphate oxidase
LNKRYLEFEKKFYNKKVPRPSHWGGFTVKPVMIEFWQGRASRLHDRIVYEKKGNRWKIFRLAP